MSFIFMVFFIFVSGSNETEEREKVFAGVGEKKLTKKEGVEMKKGGGGREGAI
jgi:hypothetical protein